MTRINTISQILWRRLKFYATQTPLYRKIYLERIQKRISRRHLDIPLSVYIEPTNRCNSNCVVCPRKIMTREQGIMEMGLFSKVVDECAHWGVKWVVLQMFGEPFMDKRFLDKARMAKAKGLKTSIYTNGSLLNRRNISQIISEGLLDHIVISIDGVNADEFNRNRPALNFTKIEKNTLRLLLEKEKNGRSVPKVKIHCTHLPEVHYNRSAFEQKWSSVSNGVTFTPTRDWGGQMPGFATTKKPDRRFPCFLLWYQFYVMWDGSVTFCSIDFDGKYAFGNVKHQTLASLWQSNFMAALRRQHLHDSINEDLLCSKCVYSTHEKTWWWHDPEKVLFL